MHVAKMEEDRSAFKILTDKSTGKRPLGGPRGRWEDNNKFSLKEIWIDLSQNRRPCEFGIEPLVS